MKGRSRRKDRKFLGIWMLGILVCLSGCEEYSDEEWYDAAEYTEEWQDDGYDEKLMVGEDEFLESFLVDEDVDSAEEFGNGIMDGGEAVTEHSIWWDETGEWYGSSGKLEGKIAVVTILVNDTVSTWNLEEETDFKLYSRVYNNLKIGCSWISQVCAEYGREVEFIWDWVEHSELLYRTTLSREIGSDYPNAYKDMQSFVEHYVDSENIKANLGADGIIYMICVDTPSDNTTASSTYAWKQESPCEYEMCFMLMNYKGQVNAPATFAHEILHTFGAPDLYYAGGRGITQEYVEYAKNARSNDIMRVTWDLDSNYYVYDRVCNEITDVTAYYLGLTDYSQTVEDWNLGESDYTDYGEEMQ